MCAPARPGWAPPVGSGGLDVSSPEQRLSSPSSPLLRARLTVLLCVLQGEPGPAPGPVELVLTARPFMEEAREVRRPRATGMKEWVSAITARYLAAGLV